jgi:hypothetical protein
MRVALFTVATSPVKAQAWLFVEGKGMRTPTSISAGG